MCGISKKESFNRLEKEIEVIPAEEALFSNYLN